jgi:hypothetical protein
MTAADVGLLDRPPRLIEVIAAIKDLRFTGRGLQKKIEVRSRLE